MRIMRELYTSSMEILEEPQAGTVNVTPTLYDQGAVGEKGRNSQLLLSRWIYKARSLQLT